MTRRRKPPTNPNHDLRQRILDYFQTLRIPMAEDELDASLIRLALAPSARAPVSIAPRNIICKCADVSDVQIRKELARGSSLAVLQDKLKCGTFCGSCVPDLKRMAAEFKSEETAPA